MPKGKGPNRFVALDLPKPDIQYVYMSQPKPDSKNLLIVIQKIGKLRMGQWSEGAERNHSLVASSMTLQCYWALKSKFVVLLMNHNENSSCDVQDGEQYPFPRFVNPEEHALHVWDYVKTIRSQFEKIYILAHGSGGELVFHIDKYRNVFETAEKVAFIDYKKPKFPAIITPQQRSLRNAVARQFNMDCSTNTVDDMPCEVIDTDEPELMPFEATKQIFAFFGISTEQSTVPRRRTISLPSNKKI